MWCLAGAHVQRRVWLPQPQVEEATGSSLEALSQARIPFLQGGHTKVLTVAVTLAHQEAESPTLGLGKVYLGSAPSAKGCHLHFIHKVSRSKV